MTLSSFPSTAAIHISLHSLPAPNLVLHKSNFFQQEDCVSCSFRNVVARKAERFRGPECVSLKCSWGHGWLCCGAKWDPEGQGRTCTKDKLGPQGGLLVVRSSWEAIPIPGMSCLTSTALLTRGFSTRHSSHKIYVWSFEPCPSSSNLQEELSSKEISCTPGGVHAGG